LAKNSSMGVGYTWSSN